MCFWLILTRTLRSFRPDPKGKFKKDQELSFSKKTITASLLPLSEDLSKRAVGNKVPLHLAASLFLKLSTTDLFGKIIMYTSKKPPAKPEMIVEYILTEALVEEKLRDELYCQLVRGVVCCGVCLCVCVCAYGLPDFARWCAD